jgi:hypothetical protein
VEGFRRNLVFQRLGRLRPLQDLVLPQRKQTFEEKLPNREANDQLLPGEARSIKEGC